MIVQGMKNPFLNKNCRQQEIIHKGKKSEVTGFSHLGLDGGRRVSFYFHTEIYEYVYIAIKNRTDIEHITP